MSGLKWPYVRSEVAIFVLAHLRTAGTRIYFTLSVLPLEAWYGYGEGCSGQQHLPESRGPKRSIQTPQLYPRPEKTGTIEPHQTGQAWADWRRGPGARGGRGGQQQRERSPQHHGSRGTAVRHTGECIQNQKTNSGSCLRNLCTHRRAVPMSTQFLWYPSQKRPHSDGLNLFSGGGGG